MKNKLTTFLIWFFFIAIFAIPILAEYSYVIEDMQLNPFDYARITDVEYRAVVVDEPDSRGKVVITERLTFDIHAASVDNLFWELWRDLPEDYVDGVKVDYKVNSVKQILSDGTEIIYDKSPKLYWEDEDYVSTNPNYGPGKWYHSKGPYDEENAKYECVFFYTYGLYREEVVFEIEYEMRNAALRYNDCSDLYLAMYSGSTIKYLESFKAQILFPEEDMPSYGNYKVYTYGTNSNDFPVTESDTINPGYHTFSFELNEEQLKFKPYNQYIEFDLVAYGEDRHIFTEHAPSNYYTYDNVLDEIYDEQQDYASAPETFRVIKIIVCLLLSATAIFIMIYAFTTKKRMHSKYIFYKPDVDIEYFRDIPSDLDPNFAASLVFCKHKAPKDDSGIYSAILLSLARKKYIELHQIGTNDVHIIIKKPYGQTLWQVPGQPPVQPTPWQVPGQFPPQATMPNMGMQAPNMGIQPLNMGIPTPNIGIQAPNMDVDTPDIDYEPLTPCEEYYFNLLVRHAIGNTITMSTFQRRVSSDYENTDAFVRNMEKSIVNIGVRERYFQKADFTQPKKQIKSLSNRLMVIGILFTTLVNIISYQTRMDLAFGGFFILGISCIISSIYLKKQANKFLLLTQFGEDEYEKWRGLYNFLNSETLIHERTVVELPLWEKYLVYATAFGLSEKVIQAISIRCPETSSSPILNNTYYRSGNFRHSGHSFRSAVRSGSSIARSGGGGFGYGGGGRGGGGGGGGH